MSDLNTHITIPKDVSVRDDLDFHFLKKEGVAYLEELGGNLWTDFNSHDPGVTFLEMLCYAITDLGMRIEMPIEDLLSSTDDTDDIPNQFYKAFEVFPTKAVTALDYRKLFIDLEGVKNCWPAKFERIVYVDCRNDLLSYNAADFELIPEAFKRQFTLKGLYKILVDFDGSELTESEIDDIKESIKTKYHANRNLCEDLIEISAIGEQEVSVCAAIEVKPEADEEWVHAQVLHAIDNYFSPFLHFYGIKELLDKGYTTDEIFDGPLLENGFLDTEELKQAELRSEVRLSDLIQLIMAIEGVLLIKDISIGNCDGTENDNDWVICIDPEKKPVRCDNSAFSYFKGVLPLNINTESVERYLSDIKEAFEVQKEIAKSDKRLNIPQGNYLSVDEYTTIQNDFPDTYGIGQEGIPGVVDTQRKAQAKQLKAYLLFFDKILASYFKHLGKVKDLLSINGSETKTYFTQAVKDIKGFDDLVSNYPLDNDEALTEKLFKQLDNNIERRNQIIDHLLSRFAERFGEYTFVMKMLYGTAADELVLLQKETFLNEYPKISANRGCGFNYHEQPNTNLWNTDNVSGVQHRVSRLLGIRNYRRRHLHNSLINIEELVITPDNSRYAWQIKDTSGIVLLSGLTDHASHVIAANEAYLSILQLIQTPLDAVETELEGIAVNGQIVGNVEIIIESPTKYSFVVINSDGTVTSQLAEHPDDYTSQTLLKEKLLETLEFARRTFTEEGMFLVEHMLLRPDVTNITSDTFMPICTDNCESCDPLDPYSYRVSIVLPGYTYRFSDPDFRKYAETIIREELPSHVLPRICWVGHRKGAVPDEKNDLFCFEDAWKKYLFKKTTLEQLQPDPELQDIIDALSKLNTIYPVGRLLDCDDEGDGVNGKFILGRSNLGTLKNIDDDD